MLLLVRESGECYLQSSGGARGVAKDHICFGFWWVSQDSKLTLKTKREVFADKQQRQKILEKAKIKLGKQHSDNIFEDTPSKDSTLYFF